MAPTFRRFWGGTVALLGHSENVAELEEARALALRWRDAGFDVLFAERGEPGSGGGCKVVCGRRIAELCDTGRSIGTHEAWAAAPLRKELDKVSAQLQEAKLGPPRLHVVFVDEGQHAELAARRLSPGRTGPRPKKVPPPARPAPSLASFLVRHGLLELEPDVQPESLDAALTDLNGVADLEERLLAHAGVAELYATTDQLELLLAEW